MDVEQLHVILQQSFSADASIRKPAEEQIKNLKNLPGSVVLLLQVAAEKQVSPFFVRNACAVVVYSPRVPFVLCKIADNACIHVCIPFILIVRFRFVSRSDKQLRFS
jgi:hypothetical protein